MDLAHSDVTTHDISHNYDGIGLVEEADAASFVCLLHLCVL